MKKFILFCIMCGTCANASAQNTHSIILTWLQSASNGITSNNVYQASASGGPYTKVFSSTSPIITYTVPNLAGGTTFYFVVTAVCSTCSPQESPFSNFVQAATLGNQPSAPTGLTATAN